jgi:hypothetical protein
LVKRIAGHAEIGAGGTARILPPGQSAHISQGESQLDHSTIRNKYIDVVKQFLQERKGVVGLQKAWTFSAISTYAMQVT